MQFKPLPPGAAAKLIKGHTDVLSPLAAAQDTRIRSSKCPRCGGTMQVRLHPSYLFTDGSLLPRSVAYCVDCGCTIDPVTNLVLDTGSFANLADRPKADE